MPAPVLVAQSEQAEPVDDTGHAQWVELRDQWETCSFGGDGDVQITPNLIRLGIGDPLTGVRWTGAMDGSQTLQKDNYEIEFEGRRIEGFDFFCGFTFPVGDEQCSLVCGGWGGGILGLSSIDGSDASENETTQFKEFENGTWVTIRVRVTPEKIQCWIDGDDWVDVERSYHQFDIRLEMDPALPLGLANYQCVSEFRNIRYRSLSTE
ncbi:MAG: family 16 glycoside hydrolase [Planctomycetota bacterium]